MIHVNRKEDCCGCNACGDACPKGAIHFKRDEEGFLYPVVDQDLCVDCGLCERVCPQIHVPDFESNEYAEPKVCAGVHKNLEVRFDSTSGGCFSALAEEFYRLGGFVAGAVWGEGFSIRQVVSDRETDLKRLRSSKYAQSDARGFYSAVRDALKTGKPVLVCGTPCQMVALRLFLGKPCENLLIVDFICLGVNSPEVLEKYLDWKGRWKGSPVQSVKFKNKELGWRNLTMKFVFRDGSVSYEPASDSYFMRGYLAKHLYCRPSCYECRYKRMPRFADLTVADCWGCKEVLGGKFDNDLGTSLVLINNSIGEKWVRAISSSMMLKKVPWDLVRKGNPMLERSLALPEADRDSFFHALNEKGFDGVVDKFFPASRKRNRLKFMIRRFGRLAMRHRLWPWNLSGWLRCWRVNGLAKIVSGQPLLITEAGVRIEKAGELSVDGADSHWGRGRFEHPPMQTRVRIEKGARLSLRGRFDLTYGGLIEVFPGGHLDFAGENAFNINNTIICANRIRIGKGVVTGRNVTIRDNNGGHWINHPGYENSSPVIIGDHVWLCEGCIVMPGVTIGAGAVVGARSVVTHDVPPNTLVAGNPARVIRENVEWKY